MRNQLILSIIVLMLCLSFFSGCTDENSKPTASFSISLSDINVNDLVYFNSTSSDDGEIINYTWYVNGDTYAYTEDITYRFSENGSYSIALRVTDDLQVKDKLEKAVFVGGDEKDFVKQQLIGTWTWSGNNQTGVWSYFENDSCVVTFTGMAGSSVTDWWRYDIMNDSEICFSDPSDDKLLSACYEYEFQKEYTIAAYTFDGNTELWYKNK